MEKAQKPTPSQPTIPGIPTLPDPWKFEGDESLSGFQRTFLRIVRFVAMPFLQGMFYGLGEGIARAVVGKWVGLKTETSSLATSTDAAKTTHQPTVIQQRVSIFFLPLFSTSDPVTVTSKQTEEPINFLTHAEIISSVESDLIVADEQVRKDDTLRFDTVISSSTATKSTATITTTIYKENKHPMEVSKRNSRCSGNSEKSSGFSPAKLKQLGLITTSDVYRNYYNSK
ncbi:hypothetical protein HK098_007348 [Nowakowskiella sp. JEL0407]|nr:hypothetical protein HK098_007348 [Nowakowskiella sp. JEL0407]